MKIVMKFGGTSVGTGENIRHVATSVTQVRERRQQSRRRGFCIGRRHQQFA